jgi:GNAT superfamily N-acetyltransferase
MKEDVYDKLIDHSEREIMKSIANRSATSDDVPFIAWVMQEAGRSHLETGMWDLAFPGPNEHRLKILGAIASTDAVHMGHYSRFIITEVDGIPAAALSAYEYNQHGGDNFTKGMAEAFKKMDFTDEEMVEVGIRMSPFKSLNYVNHAEHWIVEWVATSPEFRGQGLISGLLHEILEQGRSLGFKDSQVGYYLGNTPAKNAYEKIGFKYVTEYRHPDFEEALKCPGIASMYLEL